MLCLGALRPYSGIYGICTGSDEQMCPPVAQCTMLVEEEEIDCGFVCHQDVFAVVHSPPA